MSGEGEGLRPGPVREAADKVIVECDFDAPPEKLWRALTQPHLVAAWLMEGDIDARVGRHFTLKAAADDGGATVACEVLAVEPGRLLSYSWREVCDEADGPGRETIVTFAVSANPSGGAHLRLVHDAAPGRPAMILARRRRPAAHVPDRLAGARRPTTMRWAA